MLLGISPLTVKHRRLRLGISPPGRKHFRLDPWQPREDALLGTASDRELARRLGHGMERVQHSKRHSNVILGCSSPASF